MSKSVKAHGSCLPCAHQVSHQDTHRPFRAQRSCPLSASLRKPSPHKPSKRGRAHKLVTVSRGHITPGPCGSRPRSTVPLRRAGRVWDLRVALSRGTARSCPRFCPRGDVTVGFRGCHLKSTWEKPQQEVRSEFTHFLFLREKDPCCLVGILSSVSSWLPLLL